jgi:uncharacterized repeat protein (TIGR01451 family)
MKNYFKKFSIMFVMSLMLVFGCSISAFASTDDAVVGTANLNNTTENSAKVRDQLTMPEKGWKRYDDTDNKIEYTGSWETSSTSSTMYKNTCRWIHPNGNESIKFTFYGTKIRYYSNMNNSCSSSIRINIDGNEESFNEYSTIMYTTPTPSTLVYEKTGLTLGFHTVIVNVNMNVPGLYNGLRVLGFDAIDIDDNGYLIDKNKSIAMNKSSMNLIAEDSGQLIATTPAGAQVTWTSSAPSIATVDSTGKVTGVKEGTCTITAITSDGLTAICTVTVTPKGTEPIPTPEPTSEEKIINIAHAKGDNTNNAGGDVTIIFHGAADTTLSVVKTADVKDVWVGDNFTYTLVITNTGTKTAKAVVVNDPAPNHIDFNVSGVTTTQGTVDSSSTSKNIIVNVGDILPGGTVTIKIPSTVIA